MLELMVTAYCAPDVVLDCINHASAHSQVLELHDLSNITSAKQDWWNNSNTFVLLLKDVQSGEPLGGVRLQRWNNNDALPIESALTCIDSNIYPLIASFAEHGVGELCGLWCSPKLKGFQLGSVLIRMGLAVAANLQTQTLFALCNLNKADNICEFGFIRECTLVNNGVFEYPRPDLYAQVLKIPNTLNLFAATPENNAIINSYRDTPVGIEMIERVDNVVELKRDLVTNLKQY